MWNSAGIISRILSSWLAMVDGGYTAVLYYLSTFMVGRPLWILALNSTVAFDQSCVFSLGVSCAMDILPSEAQTIQYKERRSLLSALCSMT